MKRGEVKLTGTQNPVQDGVGAALRSAHAITDEGDARIRQLLDQLRSIKGRGDQ